MRAWVNDVGNGRIELREVPDPLPGPGEVVVRMGAAGVNRADLAMRLGRYRPGVGSTKIAGIEGAGVVVATGEGCDRFAVGRRVMGMFTGTYAELAVIDEGVAMAIPDGCSFTEAAVLPVGCCTQHDALVTKGELRQGDSVLVTAATAGVGELACKIAHVMGAGTVIGSTRSIERASRVVGADHVVATDEQFVRAVLSLTDGEGVGVVIDHVAGAEMQRLIEVTRLGGRIVSVGRLGGSLATLDIDELQMRRLSLIGVTFRTRTLEDYRAIARAAESDLGDAIASGRLRALVEEVFSFDRADAAQRALEEGHHVGKLVIEMNC